MFDWRENVGSRREQMGKPSKEVVHDAKVAGIDVVYMLYATWADSVRIDENWPVLRPGVRGQPESHEFAVEIETVRGGAVAEPAVVQDAEVVTRLCRLGRVDLGKAQAGGLGKVYGQLENAVLV